MSEPVRTAPYDEEDALEVERDQDRRHGLPPYISQSGHEPCMTPVGKGWCWRIKGHEGSHYPGLSENP